LQVTSIILFEMADRDTATGVLGLVQAYVNSVDLQDGPEELSDPGALGAWLVAHGLMESGQAVTESDLKHAIAVREAIRGVIATNAGAPVYPLDIATLNEAATASRLRAKFGGDGKARLEPEAGGVAGAMGRVVAAVFSAMADEDWHRLKICDSTTCRWVFYDQSRNHSSRWCTMASCGNRAKARRFRDRVKSGSAS
jgi:predicted RNA-binding Zn ribbon-like protein